MAISRRELLRIIAGGAAAAAMPGCATRLRGADTDNQAGTELTSTVAYCGLVCGVCRNAVEKRCAGCRNGGGNKNCYQKKCCVEKGLDGCWQCEEFPCDNGFFADSNKMWRGLCVGSAQCIQDYGLEGYVDRMVSRLGNDVDYLEYKFKDIQEIKSVLCGG